MKFPVFLALSVALGSPLFGAGAAPTKIVLLAGRQSHPPLQHEFRAGSLLLQKCLGSVPGVVVRVFDQDWPATLQDGRRIDANAELEDATAIVIYSDGEGRHPALQGDRLAFLERLSQRGVGIGLLHYAVEPTTTKGQKEFLDWVGGAFETHWSVNPHWMAEFSSLPEHPVTRGVKPFSGNDEWYFNIRFREGMQGVTSILSAIPPPSTTSRPDGPHEGNPAARAAVAQRTPQTVMWLSERPQRGRGFGFTGGHFHHGWKNDDQRKLVLNAILWVARVDVPTGGVASIVTDEDLKQNLDPKPPRPAAAPAAPPK